jgi:FlaA1/EpsC-like NDP-sugar epimerase
MRLIDFGLISLSGVALSLYWTAAVGDSWRCLFLTFGIAAAAVVIFQFLEIYHVLQFRILRLSRMTLGLFIAVLLAMGGSHFIGLHDATLQSWFAAFFCTGIVALISERLVLRAVLRKWGKEGRLDRRTIIVGADKNGEQLITALRAQEGSNVDILGVFDDRGDGRAQEICAGVSKLGKVDDILEFAYRTRVDLILFALPISAEKRILQMLRKLWFFRSISTFRPTQVNFASVLAIIQILHRRQHYQCLKSQSPIGTW